jgi:DNA modification methylase
VEPVRIGDATLYTGDVMEVLRALPDESVHCVVTSPPYWGLRDYGTGQWEGGSAECDHKAPPTGGPNPERYPPGGSEMFRAGNDKQYLQVCGKCGAHRIDAQIGLESTPEEYVAKMVEVFREVRRVLRKDGTAWVNMGDCYAHPGASGGTWNGSSPESRDTNSGATRDAQRIIGGTLSPGLKAKDLVGVPWRLAFALQADGWYLRSDIIWAKLNPMPESVTDRPTKAHEYVFLLSKSAHYFYDAEAIKESVTGGTHARISQNLAAQVGSFRANGGNKTNGPMKAVIAGSTRKMAEAGSGIKNNASYAGAMVLPVERRNKRTVWEIPTESYSEAHFATFPRKLVQPCILAGCPEHACPKCGAPWVKNTEPGRKPVNGGAGWRNNLPALDRILGEHPTCNCSLPAVGGTVLDPFGGSGTTAEVALEYGRQAILIELKPEYVDLQRRRLAPVAGRPLLNFAGGQA